MAIVRLLWELGPDLVGCLARWGPRRVAGREAR